MATSKIPDHFKTEKPVAILVDGGFFLKITDKRTAAIFIGRAIRDLPMKVQRHARAKLLIIGAADRLDDLRIPPGNQLEALRGDRQGQYSIRINKQWRICFIWRNGEAWQVEIVDDH